MGQTAGQSHGLPSGVGAGVGMRCYSPPGCREDAVHWHFHFVVAQSRKGLPGFGYN